MEIEILLEYGNNILEFIRNNKLTEIKDYIEENNIKSEDFDEFDSILLYSIENNASTDIIEYIISLRKNKCLMVDFFNSNGEKVNFLLTAIKNNNFKISTLLINHGADINYIMDGNSIIDNLKKYDSMNYKNLKFIVNNGLKINYIKREFLDHLIDKDQCDILNLILTHFKYNNKFILHLLSIYKNKESLSVKQMKRLLLTEKEKIVIDEAMYKKAIEKKNYSTLRILFENESSKETKILNRIIKYDILEKAIESGCYSFIEKVLHYETFNNKNINYEKILTNTVSENKLDITKLLLKTFVNASYYNTTINTKIQKDKNVKSEPSNSKCHSKAEYINLALNLAIKLKSLPLVQYMVEDDAFKTNLDINAKDIYGDYPIITAFYADDIEIFKYLLEHGADCNTKNGYGISILLLAIHNNNSAIVKYLLEYDADINETDANGNSPLMKAVYQNSSEIVELLIDYADDNDIEIHINEASDHRNHPLIKAINQNNMDMVFSIVQYGVTHGIAMNIHDVYGNTPLILSYNLGYQDIFKYLIKYLDVNQKDSSGKTILFYAIDKKDIDTINNLINVGAEVNMKDSSGNTILNHAITTGNIEILRILLKKYDLLVNEVNSEGETPILMVIKSNIYKTATLKEEIINRLIEKGCNINSVDKEGNSALIHAINNRYLSIIKLLLNNGVNVDSKNKENKSALNIVLFDGNSDITKCFYDFGYDVNDAKYIDVTNFSVISKLIEQNKFELLKRLVTNDDFDINMKNKNNGNTLLMEAVISENPSIVKYLVDHGADKTIKNNSGYTASQINDNNNNRYSYYNHEYREINDYLNS